LDDLKIIERLRQGETGLSSALVRRYKTKLKRYLSKFPLEEAVAEELAQETFLRAFKNIDRFDNEHFSSFSGWLFTIAKHLVLNELSRSYRKFETRETNATHRMPDRTLSADELLEQDWKQKQLIQAIMSLEEPFRTTMKLFYLEDRTLEQIASLQRCSLGTVKSRLFRGKAAVKVSVTKEG
jgi:RNA polymerase sigma-70 factor (ECF subfamily)